MNTATINPAITPDNIAPTRFAHDCSNCQFLRSVFLPNPDTNRTEQFDVYRCQRVDKASFIARFGSEGPEYTSCPEEIIEQISSEIPENQAIKIVAKEWQQCQEMGIEWSDFLKTYATNWRGPITPDEPVSF